MTTENENKVLRLLFGSKRGESIGEYRKLKYGKLTFSYPLSPHPLQILATDQEGYGVLIKWNGYAWKKAVYKQHTKKLIGTPRSR
jgi:hypothetical protein